MYYTQIIDITPCKGCKHFKETDTPDILKRCKLYKDYHNERGICEWVLGKDEKSLNTYKLNKGVCKRYDDYFKE